MYNYPCSNGVVRNAAELVSFNETKSISRFKRSFGGQESVNITLVNENILGPAGFLSLASASALDLIFHISGYVVLGRFFYSFLKGVKIYKLN